MIIHQRLVQIVVQLFADEFPRRLVLKFAPGSLFVATQDLQSLAIEAKLVLGDVPIEVFAAHHFRDATQLIVVVFPAEKGSAVEHDAEKHARQRPDIQRIVVFLSIERGKRGNCVVGEKFGSFVVACTDTDVVSLI